MKFQPLKCANPNCKMQLLNLKATDLFADLPKINDILLCGMCGALSKVTLTGTEPLTPEEFNNLSDDERKALDFAARAVKKQLKSN